MRRTLALALLLLFILSAQGCGWSMPYRAARPVTLTQEHLPGSALHVDTQNGSVGVLASSEYTDVTIEAKLTCGGGTQAEADRRLREARLDASRDTSRALCIRPIFPGGRRGGDGASIAVRLPDVGDVDVNTSNGRIEISGSRGEVIVDTSNGSIDLIDHNGPATIETSNGAVHAVHTTGPLEIDTSNGRVLIESHEGMLRIDTSNGAVIVTDQAGETTIDTSNGSITLTLRPDATGPVDLDTSNSSISLTIGPAFAGPMTLRTSNASISIHDPTGVIRAQEIGKSRARLTIGGDGPESRLRTSNGRVSLTVNP
ncbi:MAG: DUF4097 family beta strand repeat-containing protein [Planctomycetota bacterium]|nr:DUF4097 family beta strand repeat-containing protein [Planctomycetota bacterium]